MFGMVLLVLGVVLSMIVFYLFYIKSNRTPTTFALLSTANVMLILASKSFAVSLPPFLLFMLWAGFFISLIGVFFSEYFLWE
jgi:hypothetical protein